MIKRVVLDNFMSHEHTEIEFNGSTIAVVGDNGSGKSAFLEAIPYAYFGIAREVKGGLSRIKGDGSHRVEIWEDGDIRVIRGQKSGGAGFTEVRVAGEIVGKGKEAETWIEEHLGMNGDVFMLTSFFGLTDAHTDKLLRVQPASRLEAMQGLANVGPYRNFLATAKTQYKAAEGAYEREKARAEGAEAVLSDDEKLQDGLSAGHKVIEDQSEVIKKLKESRHDLQVEEEKYQAFVREKERLTVERDGIKRDVRRLEDEKDTLQSQAKTDKKTITENRKELAEAKQALEGSDEAAVSAEVAKFLEDIAATQAVFDLKDTALHAPLAEAKCPLCEQPISQKIRESWASAVTELEEKIHELSEKESEGQEQLEKIRDLKTMVSHLDRETKTLISEVQKAEKRVAQIDRELRKLDGELKRKDDRFIFLVEKLGEEYQGLQQRIKEVNGAIDNANGILHMAKGEMEQLKAGLKRNAQSKKIIREARALMSRKRRNMEALNLLQQAWNRYGIPLQLIERMSRELEVRASAVYQEFDNGAIEVREVEDRGKPGIQFVLVDRKGDRTFNQLSLGEKVMFFVAVRVAIAQIVAQSKRIMVDYLILDEVMGNLSPKRRDDLIRLINKVLRKLFPQVVMVSHTEMRDIFTQTIRMKAENEVSVAEVV